MLPLRLLACHIVTLLLRLVDLKINGFLLPKEGLHIKRRAGELNVIPPLPA